MRILSWVQTDVGQKRDHNEDSYLAAPEAGLYVVADGMGGHAGGDQASSIAVTLLQEGVEDAGLSGNRIAGAPGEEPPALRVLREASRRAGEVIFDMAQQNPHLAGMGTTLTALLFHGGRVHMAHVGDSRAYLFRDGRIEQLTEDHSWINEQVKAGLITNEEARHSKFKHIITRSVGFERDVAVDVMSLPVLMGDCFLMCSDGLSNYVENDELGQMLSSNYYGRIPKQLVNIANERGGDDNITVMLVYVANDSGPPLCTDMTRPGAATNPNRDPSTDALPTDAPPAGD
jgi:protein phosphatase